MQITAIRYVRSYLWSDFQLIESRNKCHFVDYTEMLDRSSRSRMVTMAKKQGPKDLNESAFRVFQVAVGEVVPEAMPEKDPAAVSLGRRGGLKGGNARAKALTPEQRSEIAKKAANSRWKPGTQS